MSPTLEQHIDAGLAAALQKNNPGLAAAIDTLIELGEDEDRITEAIRRIVKRMAMRPAEATMTYAAIVAYVQQAFASRRTQDASA